MIFRLFPPADLSFYPVLYSFFRVYYHLHVASSHCAKRESNGNGKYLGL